MACICESRGRTERCTKRPYERTTYIRTHARIARSYETRFLTTIEEAAKGDDERAVAAVIKGCKGGENRRSSKDCSNNIYQVRRHGKRADRHDKSADRHDKSADIHDKSADMTRAPTWQERRKHSIRVEYVNNLSHT